MAPLLGVIRLVRTSGGTRGDNGPVKTSLGDDVNLDGGVTTRVVDGTSVNLLDSHDDDGWWIYF